MHRHRPCNRPPASGSRGGETLRAEGVALAARGPRLLEEVKANGTREAFDERGRAFDELGVYVTHLVILVPGGSGRGGWRRCRADDSDLCRRVSSGAAQTASTTDGPGRANFAL